MHRKLTSFAACAGFLSMCLFFVCPKNNRIPNQPNPHPNFAMNQSLAKRYYSLLKKSGAPVKITPLANCAGSNTIPTEKIINRLGLHYAISNKATHIEIIPIGYNWRASPIVDI